MSPHYSYTKITPLAQGKWENQVQGLSLTYKSLKLGQLSYLHSLLSFIPFTSLHLVFFLITLSRPSLTSSIKIVNILLYHFPPALWNTLPSEKSRWLCGNTLASDANSPGFNSRWHSRAWHRLSSFYWSVKFVVISKQWWLLLKIAKVTAGAAMHQPRIQYTVLYRTGRL